MLQRLSIRLSEVYIALIIPTQWYARNASEYICQSASQHNPLSFSDAHLSRHAGSGFRGTSTSAPSARAAGAPLTSAFQRYADRARQAAGLPPVPEDGGDDAMTEVEMEVLASAEAYRTPGSGGRFG